MRTSLQPYQILEIAPDASIEEAQAAFRRKAAKAHPDKGGTAEEFTALKRAFDDFKKARRSHPCACNGRGYIELRHGLAVVRSPCPNCWRTK